MAVTIGNMRRNGYPAATRSAARTWASSRSGRLSPRRRPLTPRKGFCLRLRREIRERLVGAGVERAQDERAAAEAFGDLPVGALLLVLVRLAAGADEQELRAQKSDAVGAGGQRCRDVVRAGDVGLDPDREPVARDGRESSASPGAGLSFGAPGRAGLSGGGKLLGGLDGHGTRLAVDEEQRSLGDSEQGGAGSHDCRDAESARHDRPVRRRPAGRARDAAHEGRVESRDESGRQLVNDEDAGLDRQSRLGRSRQPPQHLIADAAQVCGARALVRVFERSPTPPTAAATASAQARAAFLPSHVMPSRAGPSKASSSRNSRWASRISASYSFARPASDARARRMPMAASASATSRAARSAAPSAGGASET